MEMVLLAEEREKLRNGGQALYDGIHEARVS